MQNTLLQHRIKSAIITISIFILLILIMLWIKFRTPIPPYPEGGGGPGMGLEVNLGSGDQGMGENQDVNIASPKFQETQAEAPAKEEILTSDDEESEAIKNTPEKKPKKEIKSKVVVEPVKKTVKKESTDEHKPVLNQKALFPAHSANEGNTSKAGQQGNPNGTPGGGSGGGTGGGSGTGTGTDAGSGISFNLEGRSPSFLKKPTYKGQSEGRVVVEITVDKNGKVTSARPGVSGSTILDEDLMQVAKEAALQSTFTPKPDATVQKGKITYHFMLQ